MSLIAVTSARVAAVVLQLVYIKLYTNLLSIQELGHYAYWFTIAYFFNALVFVPFDNFQQSRLYKWKDAGVSLRGAVRMNVLLLLLCAAAILAGSCVALVWHSWKVAAALGLSLAYGLVLHVSNAARNLTNNLNRRSMASAFLIVDGSVKVLVLLVLSRFVDFDSVTLIASGALGSLVSAAICLRVMARTGVFFEGMPRNVDAREAFEFSYPISISAMLNWLQLQGYRLVLVPLGAAEAVGAFATISSIGAAGMNAVGSVYSQLRTPELYRSGGKSIDAYLAGVLGVTGLVAVGGWLFSRQLVALLTSPALAEHAGVIVFGILVEGGNLVLGAMGIAHSLNRPTRAFIAVGLWGFMSCALGFAVLYKWIDVSNIGFPLVVSQAVAALSMWSFIRKDDWLRK